MKKTKKQSYKNLLSSITYFGFLLFLVMIFKSYSAQQPVEVVTASAELINSKGQPVGKALLKEEADGVSIQLTISGLKPGSHGVHFHEKGKCEAPGFESAGKHLNPENHEHGLENEKGPHAGDLPNIEVTSSAASEFKLKSTHVTLKAGKNSLLRPEGVAIIIHDGSDDQKSDPIGNSGGRAICGVVRKLSPLGTTGAKIISSISYPRI